MINRNFSNEQIEAIKTQMAIDLKAYAFESADVLFNCYLTGDESALYQVISSWVDFAEDNIIKEINSQLEDDSQLDNNYDYNQV
jgi:hypothetical protein